MTHETTFLSSHLLGFCGCCALLLHEWRGKNWLANYSQNLRCEANLGSIMCTFPGAARVPEEVEEVEADSAPPQSAQAATRLHQPQRVSPHTGVPAALLSRQPDSQRTPCGYCGDVILTLFSACRYIMDPSLVLTASLYITEA